MGLFDMFKGDSEEMTPHFAFATSLLYMMGADGEFDTEEIGHLLSVLGGSNEGGSIGVGANNKALLDRATKYVRKNNLDTFLTEVTPILSDAQKMCMLINLIDSSLSDGQAEPEEQAMFGKIMTAFGISEDRFKPFFEVIVLKNDRSVFTNQNHPKNQDGYKVKLDITK
jgi:uncharacterized tellurite resistance protein B-like protein